MQQKQHTLRCGVHTVGFIRIRNVDMYHITGHFEPGPDFSHYAEQFARTRQLFENPEADETSDWTDELERLNELGFEMVSPDGKVEPICDLMLVADDCVEFKFR